MEKEILEQFEAWLKGTLLACKTELADAKKNDNFKDAADYQLRILIYGSVQGKLMAIKNDVENGTS